MKTNIMSEFKQVVKEGAEKVVSKTKRVLKITLVLAVVVGALVLWACTWTYSDGVRSGYLMKASYKGVVFKTYEGQLNLAQAQYGAPPLIWEFSAKNREVYDQLLRMEGKQVSLHYREPYKVLPWQGKTGYIVTKAELSGGPAN